METITTIENLHVISEISVSYRPQVLPSERPKISAAADAYQILKQNWSEDRILFIEEFKVLHLNRAHRVIGLQYVSTGTLDATLADPRVIMATALKCCSVGLILAHNHPSCNFSPSQSDIKLTEKISGACKFFDMQLLDHLIISPTGFYSFANEGILPQ